MYPNVGLYLLFVYMFGILFLLLESHHDFLIPEFMPFSNSENATAIISWNPFSPLHPLFFSGISHSLFILSSLHLNTSHNFQESFYFSLMHCGQFTQLHLSVL